MIQSVIRQEGCKYSYLKDLYSLFPEHEIYIEPFLGTGVVALNHDCKHKILNDHNKLVYYFFLVMRTRRGPEKLVEEILRTPLYLPILKLKKTGLIQSLASYLILPNVTLYGKGNTLLTKQRKLDTLIQRIQEIDKQFIKNSIFFNYDFKRFFKSIENIDNIKKSFIYCDPPYVLEKGNLESNKDFKTKDMEDLYNLLISKPWKFAISCRSKSSEFWKSKGLTIVEVGKVKGTLKKGDDSEFLACNYKIQPELF